MRAMVSPREESESTDVQVLVDSIPALIHTARPDGYLDYFNKPWLEYLGVTLDQVTGWNWTAFVHPEDVEGIVAKWRACLATGEVFEYETRIRSANGEYRWMFHRKVPLRDAKGNIVKWYGSSLDIEERKTAEEQLRRKAEELERSEFYLAEGQRLAHTGSWAWNVRTGALFWSEEIYSVYGYSPQETGPAWEQFLKRVHPEDRAQIEQRAKMEASGKGGTESHGDFRIVLPDGTVKYLHSVAHPVTHSGAVTEVIGTVMDVTEHELLTQELRRREAYLAEAQKLSHTGSFGWRPDTGEIVWSDETYRIFEYDRSVKPTIDSVVQRVHPEDRADFEEVINRALTGATHFEHAYRLLMPDSRVKHVHALAHVLQDASGNREFVGAVTDITEQRQAEAVIRQQEAELRQVLDSIPAIVWSTLPDGSNTYVNKRFADYSGSSAEQMAGSGWQALIHPDDLERHAGKWIEAVATGKPHESEVRSRRSDGQYRWQLDRGVPLRDEDGNIVKWYGVTTDIEDRKRAEEALRSSEAYLAEAQRLSQTGSWAWSPDEDIRYWSEECYRVLSFDPQDGLPRFEQFFQRIHPDDQPGFRELIETAIREKANWEADYRIVHPDGPVRDIHVLGHPVLSTSGHLVEFVGTVIDVTERKRAEEERRRSEMELRQMLDLTPQVVAVYGPNSERLYANRVALDYIGLSLEEWRQASDRGVYFHPDDQKRVLDSFDRAFSSGCVEEMELRLRKGDGTYRWFFTRCVPLRDEKGQIKRFYSASVDIDDRKRAEERLQQENVALREEIDNASMFEEIVGTSPPLKSVLSLISKVAPSDSTVLITGETGTGKELVARAIHRRSARASRAFVSVNCAAIPRDLIASELFGHEKGAFTGATQQRLGRFELANGGTIFLDEVGELPAETQIALLRVLQEHEFERVGGTRRIRADVRVIAATNRDLPSAISAGSFRSDLFYRLHVFPIDIPSLKERREDIPLLVEYFIDRYARKAGKNIKRVNKKTLELLQSYAWPGNIRELQNVVERSVILCESENFSIDENWLPQPPPLTPESKQQVELPRRLLVQEKDMIEAALKDARGRVSGPSGAAAKLGIPRSTLESKIRSLKIDKNRFKF
jgi:PAS domain S-box-containing protein